MRSPYPRDLPPVWLLLSLLTQLGLYFVAPGPRWLAPPYTHAGWGLVGAGTALSGLSALRFTHAGTGVRPFTPATQLVARGAFRWTRNPMYLGLVAITLGVAVVLGTLASAFVPPGFFAVLHLRFVRAEERFLRERFGSAYDDYCARVRRWL